MPCWGSRGRDVPPETQFLLLELAQGGPYAVLLPLIDCGAFRATLRPSGSGAAPCVGCWMALSFEDSTTFSIHLRPRVLPAATSMASACALRATQWMFMLLTGQVH